MTWEPSTTTASTENTRLKAILKGYMRLVGLLSRSFPPKIHLSALYLFPKVFLLYLPL